MTQARNLLGFIFAAVASFVYICNAIPQVKIEPAGMETQIGESPEELVAAGKKIFTGDRAQCLTCHSIREDPKARCPIMEAVGESAANRKPGLSAAQYLVESVYNPDAFIVTGYPRHQMNPANKPPIALSHDQILAVMAFLNTLGGATDEEFINALKESQDPWRKGLLTAEVVLEEDRIPIFPGKPERGKLVFEDQGCIKCHVVGSEGRQVGPELTGIGASQGAGYILDSILEPDKVLIKGYTEVIVMQKRQEAAFSWDEEQTGEEIRGVALEWIPDKKNPRLLRLSVEEFGERRERDIELAQVDCVGDTIVGVEVGDVFITYCGEYVSGDETSDVTLSILQDGRWVERDLEAATISYLTLPGSPMPSNFAELMPPREMYDLVAFLVAQKGGTP